MVVHSPINERFDPAIWEYWAILLALGGMIWFGSFMAGLEDQARTRRRQQRQQRRPRLQSGRPPRQRAISYEVGSDVPSTRSPARPPIRPPVRSPSSPRSDRPPSV